MRIHKSNTGIVYMKNSLLILCCLSLYWGNAQFDTVGRSKILRIASKIDSRDLHFRKEWSVQVDSALVSVSSFKNKIATRSVFDKTGVTIDVEFYLENNTIILAKAKQRHKEHEEHFVENYFYFRKAEVIASEVVYPIKAVCGSIVDDEEQLSKNPYRYYGLDERFDAAFLEKYVRTLFSKIKDDR